MDNEEGRVNQALQKNSDMKNLNILYNLGKSVCKIETNDSFGSGFFIKLMKGNKSLYCLMTNRHVITKKLVRLKVIIGVSYDNLKKKFMLDLDPNKRFIREFDYLNLDAIVIEILISDNVNHKYFLSPFKNSYMEYNQYFNKKIVILQYPLGQFLTSSDGSIIKINETIDSYEFIHNASTQPGSSGSPVFLNGSMYVIGIHKQGSQNGNYAHFLDPIINSLIKDNYGEIQYENGEIYKGELINNKREGVGKFYMKNGDYYIGRWINDKAQGFGRQYYPNKKLKYIGNFDNNEYNDYGVYFWENGERYEGFFRNSMATGIGKYYYINGDLYEGDFVDNIKQGQGKYICSNGNYFIGQWRNDMQNGYGEYYENDKVVYKGNLVDGMKNGYGKYYEDGALKYKGNFYDDKYDGEGKLYDSSSLYFGEWKSGQKNGNGKQFFNKGNFINEKEYRIFSFVPFFMGNNNLNNEFYGFKYCYDGNFVDDKIKGKGKLYYKRRDNKKILIYEGEWEDGLRNGNGIEYDLYGGIKYIGKFSFEFYNGEGELYWNQGNYYKGNFVMGEFDGYGKLYISKSDSNYNSINISEETFENIKEYEGEFSHSKKEGYGTAIYKDGSKYQGFWKNNKYNGEGIFIKANGEYITGHWEDGKKIGNMTLFNENGDFKADGDFNEDIPTNGSFWKNLKSKFVFKTNK